MSTYSFNLKAEGQIAAGSTAFTDFTRQCDSIEVLNEPY
jgi:hypothetical protein